MLCPPQRLSVGRVERAGVRSREQKHHTVMDSAQHALAAGERARNAGEVRTFSVVINFRLKLLPS
jgi:hypothetical protein